jgi:hypothetical protein
MAPSSGITTGGFATGDPHLIRPEACRHELEPLPRYYPVGDGIIIAAKPDGTVYWYKHIDFQTGTSPNDIGSAPTIADAPHWEASIPIAQNWQGYRALMGLLPATTVAPH